MKTNEIVNDFIGFIDGFEARNLESLRQAVGLQIASMQTSIRVVCNIAEKEPELAGAESDLLGIEEALRKRSESPIKNLDAVGTLFVAMLTKYGPSLLRNKGITKHLGDFVRSFVDAAEACKVNTVIDLALLMGQAFRDLINLEEGVLA